jgi:large subunit ribosomal protein L24
MKKIRKGDEVVVIAGKDKGRKGIVLAVLADRVLVEGVNVIKKHKKASADSAGGIQEKELPIHISNVMLYDKATKRPGRIGFKCTEDGQKHRYFKSTGELIHE